MAVLLVARVGSYRMFGEEGVNRCSICRPSDIWYCVLRRKRAIDLL
jgi:hypothetical protein